MTAGDVRANRTSVRDISPATGTMHAGVRRHSMTLQRRNAAIVLATCLATSLTGCGQAATPTNAPPVATATAAPVVTAAPTAAATEAPLPALDLLWEGAGDAISSGATYSPAVDPLTGDIWVALSFGGTIWIFSEDGTYKGSFGKPGEGEGEFNFERSTCHPCGAGALAFAPDGSLFVADVGNNRVQKFDPAHEFETEWGSFGAGDGQFADANDIVTDGNQIFVADDARQDIQVFDMDGKFLRIVEDSGWLAVDSTGNFFVSHEGTVTSYAADGAAIDQFELPDYHGGFHIWLAVDAGGRLFFNFQNNGTGEALGLGSFDPSTGEGRTWANAGESLAIAGDALYEANYTGPGWPAAVLRAYALP
jgi:NHL repeat-containing protein